MRTCRLGLLTLAMAPVLAIAPGAHAHIGDQIYPFYELLDEDLHRIDLTDGSVDDWLDVLGEPALTAARLLLPVLQLRSNKLRQPFLAGLAPSQRHALGRHGTLR